MDERPLMIKEKLKVVTFFVFMSFVCLIFSSCQTSETNKWTPPKFVKEWEIKEIKPGIPHQIISMTANRNGLFALVKAVEITYSSPKWSKMVPEMTKKEKESFIIKIIMGGLFSGTAVSNMTDEEKDQLINLLITYFIPPRNTQKISEEILAKKKWPISSYGYDDGRAIETVILAFEDIGSKRAIQTLERIATHPEAGYLRRKANEAIKHISEKERGAK